MLFWEARRLSCPQNPSGRVSFRCGRAGVCIFECRDSADQSLIRRGDHRGTNARERLFPVSKTSSTPTQKRYRVFENGRWVTVIILAFGLIRR